MGLRQVASMNGGKVKKERQHVNVYLFRVHGLQSLTELGGVKERGVGCIMLRLCLGK